MKSSTVARNLCCAILALSAPIAWGAPKEAQTKASTVAAAKAASAYEIEISRDGGDRGGRFGGSAETWILRSNGTVKRFVSLSPYEMDAQGPSHEPEVSGTFQEYEFRMLIEYLQQSKLLDLKAPRGPDDMGGNLTITLVRGKKRKSVVIPDSTPSAAASSAAWAMLHLVNSITSNTDWKNKTGLSINTGLHGTFVHTAPGLTPEESYGFSTPTVSVRDDKGKEVGVLEQTSEYGNFKLVLPPGTYHLKMKNPGLYNSRSTKPEPKGYGWQIIPETVQVAPGSLTPVKVTLSKTANTP